MTGKDRLASHEFPFVIDRKDGFIHATKEIKPGEQLEMSVGEYEWLRYFAKPGNPPREPK